MDTSRPDVPNDDELTAIRALVADRTTADGRDPLSDQALTRLSSADVEHVLAHDGATLAGYAQRDGDSLEIVADTEVAGVLLDEFAGRPVLVWTHGERSALADKRPLVLADYNANP